MSMYNVTHAHVAEVTVSATTSAGRRPTGVKKQTLVCSTVGEHKLLRQNINSKTSGRYILSVVGKRMTKVTVNTHSRISRKAVK